MICAASAKPDHVSHTKQRFANSGWGLLEKFVLQPATLTSSTDTSPNHDKMVSTIPPSRQGATDCTYDINDDDDDLRLATLALDARNALTRFGCG